MSSPTNELRVFISSTFRDLQEEREHLIKKIFPEIRTLCRDRGIRFTEVDLRWGLTDEDVALGQVIRTCLDEVDKCRPYFIGITGDRYGFIPTYLDIQKDPTLLEQYPWIEEAAIEEMSITEMEAHYAVLNPSITSIATTTARFYFRRHRETLDNDSGNDEERERLEAYQQRIRASGVSPEGFRDAGSLGELIYDDLIKIIKRDFADAKPPTPLEEERSRHEAFSLSRRRAYIANPVYLKKLNEHAASETSPLVVYAESGSGKSSLFAFWADQYRRKHPNAHVVEHYVGIGATSTDHYAIIRHVCMEVNERFDRTEEIPSEPAKLELALGQWLGYADHELKKRGERMVLILDGLNQLQGTALGLKWIPDVISPSIRLILSSTVEGTLVELKKRGWQQFGMQALSEAERETIVVRYLAEYHKSLNPEQIKRIASDYKCGHPLFLKTLLEELRLVGRHEELDAKIESYLETTGTEDLFQSVLERLEEDYNMRAVRDIMVLLSASRSGLDERELSDISGLARLKIATMIAGLDYHLVRKEGHLTFFHDYLRRAVEKRYLSDEAKQRTIHLQIAEYFHRGVTASIAENGKVSRRMAGELAYQLHVGGALDRLRECLATMPVFMSLYDGETLYEVLSYWSELSERDDVESSYRQGLERWGTEDAGERSVGLGRVADLLKRLGEWDGALSLGRERLSSAITRGDVSQEAASRLRIGWLLQLRGEPAEALEEFSRALALSTELGDRSGVSRAMGNMGVVYSSRGEYDRALECYERQLSISEELGDRSDVALAIGNMGNVYSRRGEYERALESYERQLRIVEELGHSSGVARAIGNMGAVYYSRGEYERAIASFQRQLSISEELGDRRGVSIAIGNMGSVYFRRREYDRALESFNRAAKEHRAIGFRFGLTYWLEGTARALIELVATAGKSPAAGQGEAPQGLSEEAGGMPSYLPTYVPGVTNERWEAMSLRRAHECAEECVAISEEIQIPDMLFSGGALLARIDAAEGRGEVATERLNRMLKEAADDDNQRAELHYWLWKLCATDSDHRSEALRIYQQLIEKMPKHEYKKRIEELTA
jgi:tetratricopeptide (TPR) repeat protein